MNSLISKFGKFLVPTKRSISTYTRPLFAEMKEFDDSESFAEAPEPRRQSGSAERCLNEVTLIGRVGVDPTLVPLANDRSFARFKLATNYFANDNEKVTDWHEILVVKDHLRDYILKSINKGDRVYVRGKLSYRRPPEGDNPNNQRARIILQDLVILRKKNPETLNRSNNEF